MYICILMYICMYICMNVYLHTISAIVSHTERALLGGHLGPMVPYLPQWGDTITVGRYVPW